MYNPSETTDLLDDFIKVINQLTETVKELIQMENAKAESASNGEHSRMDGLLKEEQVYILKLKGLEQRRSRLQDGLGWSGLTFRQILAAAKEQESLLSPLFSELEEQVNRLQDARDSALRVIRVRLREFASVLSTGEGQSYSDNGEVEVSIPTHFHDKYV